LAPKSERALWIKGSFPTNSFVKLSILEYESESTSLILVGSDNEIAWNLVLTNSRFWDDFKGLSPPFLQLRESDNPPTNPASPVFVVPQEPKQ